MHVKKRIRDVCVGCVSGQELKHESEIEALNSLSCSFSSTIYDASLLSGCSSAERTWPHIFLREIGQ